MYNENLICPVDLCESDIKYVNTIFDEQSNRKSIEEELTTQKKIIFNFYKRDIEKVGNLKNGHSSSCNPSEFHATDLTESDYIYFYKTLSFKLNEFFEGNYHMLSINDNYMDDFVNNMKLLNGFHYRHQLLTIFDMNRIFHLQYLTLLKKSNNKFRELRDFISGSF